MPDPPDPVGVPWPSPPQDRTTPVPPSAPGETSIPLSPEPWAEPAIWRPPAPPKRGRGPLVLVVAGGVALALVAFGIVFWPSGSEPASGNGLSSAESSTAGEGGAGEGAGGGGTAGPGAGATEPEPQSDAAFREQAGAVDGVLADMSGTRADLGSVVIDEDCSVSGIQRVLASRRSQLARARALDVGALDGGAELKDALVRALEASVESNERYAAVAPGCPSPAEVSDVNQRATDAKNEFAGHWAPIAREAGLPARSGDDI
ncbi:hypothetical protein [Actinomadura sediminis]|uniref:DUF5667 domain-containing protein n=1 Tax=Actinomadura sediminis TaxID=1038904 RepID=A0ABW3ELL1_9ACTN